MHLIVAFAAPQSENIRAAMQALAIPTLDRLLAQWTEVGRDAADASTLSPPHERAHAAALGLAGADGCLPWAAHQAAADGIAVGAHAWALVTPVHWRVGSNGVHLADPDALALDEAESRTLFDAVKPLFEREAYVIAWGATSRWYIAHESLQGLACASLDRVIGRNVDAWLPRQPEAKRLRRLQNEVQMLLHRHPLNEAREAAGALAVNSFWLSGCGSLPPTLHTDARLDDRLRASALQSDHAAWCEAWHGLDRDVLQTLLAAADRGEPVRLTLCGERNAVELAPRARAWWHRLTDTIAPRRANARILLESL
jgi:hypothetical protein